MRKFMLRAITNGGPGGPRYIKGPPVDSAPFLSFCGEGCIEWLEPKLQRSTDIEVEATNVLDDKTDVAEDSGQQVDYDEVDREEVVEQTEDQASDTEAVKDKEATTYSL
nr:hypothetical protein [Tanacetum cinerariifolium]